MATQITFRNKYRPINMDKLKRIWDIFTAINWFYWLQRAPMLLLSIPAAYGVAAFASILLPFPVNVLAGMGFESVYLGCIALADQMYDEDTMDTVLWWALNIIAVSLSALVNVLFFSGGSFTGIQPESYVHGIPLPVLSFGYSLLLQRITNKIIRADYIKQKKLEEIKEAEEKYNRENPYICKNCGSRFKSRGGKGKHETTCI